MTVSCSPLPLTVPSPSGVSPRGGEIPSAHSQLYNIIAFLINTFSLLLPACNDLCFIPFCFFGVLHFLLPDQKLLFFLSFSGIV